MPKQKRSKKKKKEFPDYHDKIKKHPELKGVILESAWNLIDHTTEKTVDKLEELWLKNMATNVRNRLWAKHGSLRKDCVGLARNKAVIAVGAGQTFNKNKDVLKQIVDIDGVKDWANRDFVIIASNHQFKPLLEMGIIPDFVMLTDGGDIALPQLTEDIPEIGQNTILMAGLHCSPKVLQAWSDQKRDIRFFLATTKGIRETFNKLTGKNPIHHMIFQGGNVLNAALAASVHTLGSTVFMCIGNDLSFPLKEEVQARRDVYYADGDYSSNQPGIGSGRDEAKSTKKWMGFTLKKKLIYTGKDTYDVELDYVGTSTTLWVYKTWLESNMLMNYHNPKAPQFQYYNCSQGGILGVMAREGNNEALMREDNWFMLDEVCPHWHTMMLADAAKQFLKAKEILCRQSVILPGAQSVIESAPMIALD